MDRRGRLTFLGKALAPEFRLRGIDIAPGAARAYEEEEWRDALVVVERGEVELECANGTRCRFRHGAVLCLVGIPVSAVHNRGSEPALLVAVSRVKASARDRTPERPRGRRQ